MRVTQWPIHPIHPVRELSRSLSALLPGRTHKEWQVAALRLPRTILAFSAITP
jgi:hypothetical protein